MRNVISIDIRRPPEGHGHWGRVNVWAIVRVTVRHSLKPNQGKKLSALTLTFYYVLTLGS